MTLVALTGWMLAAVVAAVVARRVARMRELAARAAHEVRGPLTAAGMALHLMARLGEAPPERLAALEEQLQRARLALEDLTAAWRGGSVAPRVERVPVRTLLGALERSWAPVCAAEGRPLSVGDAPAGLTVLADRARLAQATGNLVANALEHGAGAIDVHPRVLGGRLRLEVHDGGAGVGRPLAEIVRAPRRGRGARGRGLAIAAEAAARDGGRLTSEGTAVVLELPLHGAGAVR